MRACACTYTSVSECVCVCARVSRARAREYMCVCIYMHARLEEAEQFKVCCAVLQGVAVSCRALRCVVMCCNLLQCPLDPHTKLGRRILNGFLSVEVKRDFAGTVLGGRLVLLRIPQR